MNHEIHIYENAEEVSRSVAELIKNKAVTAVTEGKHLNLAISGGNTPKMLFSLMAEEYSKLIPWKTLRIFWVDERCVEPTDAESNFGMTYDTLLRQPFIPAENVFRMKGEDIPENEAIRYQKLLWEKLPVKNSFPVFDLILLGMGDDGHTASIFPDNLALLESENVVEVGVHPLTKQKRITLTGKTINNAEQVVFLITGANKAEIIKQIIHKEDIAGKYPAYYIHSVSGKLDFYLDKAASTQL